MTTTGRGAILGVGHCLGAIIRDNTDPVFDYIRAHPGSNSDIFAGLTLRRVLGPDQSVTSIMVSAAQDALRSASVSPQEIEILLGAGSVGEFSAPNALAAVHHALGLSPSCRALALNTEYSTFLDGMKIANDFIAAGTISRALIVCGMNWTQHVDYKESVCVAASDAAGAAVVGRSENTSLFRLTDWEHETDTSWYSALHQGPRPSPNIALPLPDTFTTSLMKIDGDRGRDAVLQFGLPAPPRVVARLLARNGVAASDITVIAHQVAQMIADKWKAAIAPAVYVTTHEELADMVSASVPVNLSLFLNQVSTRYLVLLGVGMEMHTVAMLYERTIIPIL